MRRISFATIWIALALAPALACRDGGSAAPADTSSTTASPGVASAPAAQTTAAPAASPAAALPPCPAGYTAHAAPDFCIKLPAGAKERSAGTSFQVKYLVDNEYIELLWSTGINVDDALKQEDITITNFKATVKDRGDLPGGKVIHLTGIPDKTRAQVFTVVAIDGGIAQCQATYDAAKPRADLDDACKSLRKP